MKNLLLLTFMFSFSLTCFPQQGKWEKALKKNSIKSYQKFIEEYSDSEYSQDAKLKLIELEFNKAKKINTIKSYEYFLNTYSENKFTKQATDNLIAVEFEQIIKENSIKSYKRFISKYPDSEFKKKAKSYLMKLEYVETEKNNTIIDYTRFLKKYPEGEFSVKAKKNLMNLEHKDVEKVNTIESYNNFLSKYPDSEFSETVSNTINFIKLGCTFDTNYISDAERSEVLKIVSMIGKEQDIKMLEKLYDFIITDNDRMKHSQYYIIRILKSTIYNNNTKQFQVKNKKVYALIDLYTFNPDQYELYSYEASLCQEIMVKLIRLVVKSQIAQIPSNEELAKNMVDAMCYGDADANAVKQKITEIATLRASFPEFVYGIDLSAMKDITERSLSDCARYQYWILGNRILSEYYENPFEYGLEENNIDDPEFKDSPNYKRRLERKVDVKKKIYALIKTSFINEKNQIIKEYASEVLKRHKVF